MNEQQKVAEAVARVTADLERGVYLTRTIQNNPRPVAYVLIDDVRTLLAELDQLRHRVAHAEERRQQIDDEAYEYAEKLQAVEAKLALAEQDARRYRWLRDVPCCTISVSRNDGHAVNYMSFEEWAADSAEWYEDVPADELERMKENNTDWAVQIYPDTPIGFHVFHGATLDTAIDAAIDASGEST